MNDATLGNESIVYVVRAPHTLGASATFTVFALIKRFGTVRDVASASAAGDEIAIGEALGDMHISVTPVKDSIHDCGFRDINDAFEGGKLTSPAIVDDIWGGCPGAPEPYDSGPE